MLSSERGILIFACFCIGSLALLIGFGLIEGAMFERVLYLFAGYLMSDHARGRRMENMRYDARLPRVKKKIITATDIDTQPGEATNT